jgi:hypothetical protein
VLSEWGPTNNERYKSQSRWQVELFFKWIKQHLRIKAFYGTSENAVKTQIWIAVSVYVLVAIIRKRLKLDASLYTLMQVFSVTVFEKASIESVILQTVDGSEPVMGNRGRTTGTIAFFSCADSPVWTLCVMCHRQPPFPR